MSAAAAPPGFGRLADRLAALRQELAAISDAGDRRVALDALRDALDRDAEPTQGADIIVGSFRVEGTLHRGAHFEVHQLRQRDAGTLHALKTPLARRASDPVLRRMLLAEAANQARVIHPACLPFRALLRLSDGRPALLTDLVDAPTLAAAARRSTLETSEAIVLARRLCGALAAIHAAGLVHGDIKPSNVLLPGGQPDAAILFDFGLARAIGEPCLDEEVGRAGTNGFLSPERQEPGALAHPTDDLFAFGRLLGAVTGSPSPSLQALIDALAGANHLSRPETAGAVEAWLADCGSAATS